MHSQIFQGGASKACCIPCFTSGKRADNIVKQWPDNQANKHTGTPRENLPACLDIFTVIRFYVISNILMPFDVP
jgi:hypothetical protein